MIIRLTNYRLNYSIQIFVFTFKIIFCVCVMQFFLASCVMQLQLNVCKIIRIQFYYGQYNNFVYKLKIKYFDITHKKKCQRLECKDKYDFKLCIVTCETKTDVCMHLRLHFSVCKELLASFVLFFSFKSSKGPACQQYIELF